MTTHLQSSKSSPPSAVESDWEIFSEDLLYSARRSKGSPQPQKRMIFLRFYKLPMTPSPRFGKNITNLQQKVDIFVLVKNTNPDSQYARKSAMKFLFFVLEVTPPVSVNLLKLTCFGWLPFKC